MCVSWFFLLVIIQHPDLDDVLTQCRIRNQQWQSINASYQFEVEKRNGRQAALTQDIERGHVLVANDQRIRLAQRIDAQNEGRNGEAVILQTHARGVTTSLIPASATNPRPLVRIDPNSRLAWSASFLRLVCLAEWSPEEVYASVPLSCRSTMSADGLPLVTIEWLEPESKDSGSQRRGFCSVAPAYGYAVVEARMERRISAKAQWQPIELLRCSDFTRYGDIYLPTNADYTMWTYYDSDGYHELVLHVRAQFRDLSMNVAVKESDFDIAIPDGAIVRDAVKRLPAYVKNRINDGLIQSQLSEVERLLASPTAIGTKQQGHNTFRLVVIVFTAISIIACCVVALFVYFKRQGQRS